MIKVHKSSNILACDFCDYNTCRESQFTRHLLTAKHINRTNRTENSSKGSISSINHVCECGKKYNARNSLWYHKKKCTYTPTPPPPPTPPLENTIVYAPEEKTQPAMEPGSGELIVLVKELMLQLTAKDKQLTELQNTVKEMIPHLGNNNTSNSNNNTTFNVQLYLENECKDALSIQEFVKRIEIGMDHLRTISRDGYVDSVSNILIKALNNMDITERPLHCTWTRWSKYGRINRTTSTKRRI